MKDRQQQFSQIYHGNIWGGQSRSGEGSDLGNIRVYMEILARFLNNRQNSIRTVIDLGCGDWSFSQNLDWGNIHYVGIDIVPDLIDQLNSKYENRNILFCHADLVEDSIPKADLFIIKEVLQHLSNASVFKFLKKLDACRYALITNDIRRRGYIQKPSILTGSNIGSLIWRICPVRFLKTDIFKPNSDICDGSYRPLLLKEPPFSLQAKELGTYDVQLPSGAIDTKQILLWQNAKYSKAHPYNS